MWKIGIPTVALFSLLAAASSVSAMPTSGVVLQEPLGSPLTEFVKRGHGGKHGRRGGHGHGRHAHGHGHGHHHGHWRYPYWLIWR